MARVLLLTLLFYVRINGGVFILHSIVSLGRGFFIQDVITYCSHQPIQL